MMLRFIATFLDGTRLTLSFGHNHRPTATPALSESPDVCPKLPGNR